MERMAGSDIGVDALRNLWEGILPAPGIRYLEDMRSVLADPECPQSGSLYLMYRDLFKNERDHTWLRAQNLRYDITVIPPQVICGEYVKTKGHFHPPNHLGFGYPEIYEVLAGEGHYLLQRGDLGDIRVFTALQGEKVIIPPGYGHVSINPSTSTLVMANLVSTEFSSEYGVFEARAGAAYYEMAGSGFVTNPRYQEVPPLIRVSHGNVLDPILSRSPLYDLIGDATSLLFLNHPESYPSLWAAE
jgi:glucose-6-phosphate isomerase